MLGYQSLDRALEVRPRHITHVTEDTFLGLENRRAAGEYEKEFQIAWANGVAFAEHKDGLRGRPPWLLEWKGPHRPASRTIETIPADLRIDHVYLISCKYGSTILHNSSPQNLFDHHLASIAKSTQDWFAEVAPTEYEDMWAPTREAAGFNPTTQPWSLTQNEKRRLKEVLKDHPVEPDLYSSVCEAVSHTSAERWSRELKTPAAQAEMYWRLIRLQAGPYQVLGATKQDEPLRYRVQTPWDFVRQYTLPRITISPGDRGQPSVNWAAETTDKDSGNTLQVTGFVEVRPSHGKFARPEAKVMLATHPYETPGYTPLK